MGCHTWCYRKIEISENEVRNQVIEQFKSSIDFYNKMIKGKLDDNIIEYYPEWTPEYGKYHKKIEERRLHIVELGLCSIAVMNRYRYDNSFNPTQYIKGKGMFVSDDKVPHDMFRIYGYPTIKLWSLKETMSFIKDNDDKITVYKWTNEKIKQFWKDYPDGYISFG